MGIQCRNSPRMSSRKRIYFSPRQTIATRNTFVGGATVWKTFSRFFHAMEKLFGIGLRATFGPCPEAGLACGNPFAKRARSTLWKECLPLRSRGSLARSAGHFAIDRRVPPSSRKCGTRARHSAIPRWKTWISVCYEGFAAAVADTPSLAWRRPGRYRPRVRLASRVRGTWARHSAI